MKFDAPHFRDESEARRYIEALRWPTGRVCPKCNGTSSYETKREGRYRCATKGCRKDFTVTTGTVMESSHIRLTVWLMAFYMMASSKKGVSAHQLHRTLDVTYKSAWFLAHRIREAMKAGGMIAPMSGPNGIVEADETYFGPTEHVRATRTSGKPYGGSKKGRGPANKRAIVALVERGGSVRTFHVASADKHTVTEIVRQNVAPEARLHTDESRLYGATSQIVSSHESVRHSAGEYVRGDVHTNSAEGYFAIFKRGMRGVYQHCREKHLHRYLVEFDFRYNTRTKLGFNDTERTALAVKGAEGKRLTYRRTHGAQLQD